jgi:peptidoglycan/LPS O-acetylase OafA/YrhL
MKRIQILDYARLAAALAVLLYHYTYSAILYGMIDSITYIDSLVCFTKYGYMAVEFFFMISGYVIFFSARHRDAPTLALSSILGRNTFHFYFRSLFGRRCNGSEP